MWRRWRQTPSGGKSTARAAVPPAEDAARAISKRRRIKIPLVKGIADIAADAARTAASIIHKIIIHTSYSIYKTLQARFAAARFFNALSFFISA